MTEEKTLDEKALEGVSGGSATMDAYRAYVDSNCTGCGYEKKHGHCFYGRDSERLRAFCIGRDFDPNAPCRFRNG